MGRGERRDGGGRRVWSQSGGQIALELQIKTTATTPTAPTRPMATTIPAATATPWIGGSKAALVQVTGAVAAGRKLS